jgi:hypothetical protein
MSATVTEIMKYSSFGSYVRNGILVEFLVR